MNRKFPDSSMTDQQRSATGLKILMIAPTPYFADRGCHVRIYEEAKGLIARGHSLQLVCYGLGKDLAPVPVRRSIRVPWYNKLEAGPSWHKLYLDLLLLFTAWRAARNFRPDLIHAHLHEGILIGWPLARMLKVPLLYDHQGGLADESLSHGFFSRGGWLHRCFSRLEGWLHRLPDMTITSSTPAMELLAAGGIDRQRLHPFPDGVDTTSFCNSPKAEGCKALSIQPDRPVIIYLGLLNRYQGTDLLLEAASLLLKKGCSFRLVIMGYPEKQYQEQAVELGIGKVVHFTGAVDYRQAALLLSAGDLAVSPKISESEANGKLLNYMACSLPVVAFDTAVNREILGDEGIYAPLGDVKQLADRMGDALTDLEQLHQKGERMRKRAEQLFSWESKGAELERIYFTVL